MDQHHSTTSAYSPDVDLTAIARFDAVYDGFLE
jgi:hypothetical protein